MGLSITKLNVYCWVRHQFFLNRWIFGIVTGKKVGCVMHFLCLLAVWWPGSQSARVFLSDGHNYEPHKNGWTDRGAVWDTDSGGTKHALCVGLALPGRRVNLRGVSRPMVKWREYSACIRYSQPYSIAGSRDVAFRCQYTAATYYLNAWTAGLSSRVVSASDCGVRGSRFESRHWQLCLSRRLLRYRVLSTGCAPLL